MAVTKTVRATKFGMQLTFRNANTQSDQTKSYNGLNYPDGSSTPATQATRMKDFLYGVNDDSGLVAVMRAMNSGYSIEGVAITASNPITFVET